MEATKLDMAMITSLAESSAFDAGRAVVDHWKDYRLDVRSKGEADIVSAADLASHRIMSARIRSAFPSHRILSEKDAQIDEYDYSGPLWVIDPIDGTANYLRGHPYSGYLLHLHSTVSSTRAAFTPPRWARHFPLSEEAEPHLTAPSSGSLPL
jgi:fructose-1,6-bisphosphatase/inositol monophosphatase family enzyme